MFKYHREIAKYLMHDLLGGPRVIKACHIVNLQKGLTPFFVVYLMWFY